ncbi:MAG: enoyl-CoA hydratase/isomerase family protein, partial [Burkholderiaceae bacterium]|nr:enoyl-CoA hydratase/isomerase family protein [Burkholderiaceae bacterium]
MFQTLEIKLEAQAAHIILNRPEVRNAFNEKMIAELTQAFREVANNEAVRVIVLAANGTSFCAGADLNWMKKMADYSHVENLADAGQLAEMLFTIYTCPKPVIAQVQGDCYAGGMGLVAACDVVFAAEGVNFCLSEVKLGLIPATISPYVIKVMGENAARRYFLTAERFSAQEALRIGLVHEVVAAAALQDKVTELAKAIKNNSPHAVRAAK